MKSKTLAERVKDLIGSDTDYDKRYDQEIGRIYRISSDSDKLLIDTIFIRLCGYSLATIIKGDYDEATKDEGLE